MAVIQKIRNQYGKVTAGLIVLALIGFLLMDAGDNLRKLFTGAEYVAKVNGDKISPKDYTIRVNEYETLYEVMGNKLDENLRSQIRTQVLNEMVFERSVQDDLDELGITITKDEEKEMISGANPDPMVMQFPYFKGENGQFDPQALMAFETKKLDLSRPEVQKALEQWDVMKGFIKRNKLFQKYTALYNASAFTPKFLMEKNQKEQDKMASVRFVKIPFTTVNDNDVKVTDAEIKEYIGKHAGQYKINDPTRSIDYISFDVKPSKDDTEKIVTAMNLVKNDFATTTDEESFVNRNSDEAYTYSYASKKSFQSPFADSILSLPAGTVFGPYLDNNNYKLTKVILKATLPDSVKCRHILVKFADRRNPIRPDSLAQKKLDSAINEIKAGGDFAQVVKKYSEDDGSKDKGGEYDFSLSQRASISKEFADFIYEGKTGEKKTVKVENDNYSGLHYIEIMSQKGFEPVSKITTASKALFASDVTENDAYAKANAFAGKNTTAKDFDEAAKKENLNKLVADNVKVNDFMIPGLGSSREIIRWIYEAKQGEVSPVFNLDGRYIIAKLTGMKDKGLMQVDESNRQMFEAQVKAEKKAKTIAEKFKSQTSLEAIATASGQAVQQADSFNAASGFIPNLGYEPKVVGYAFNQKFQPNIVSPAIKGGDGVFFISVTNRFEKPSAPVDPMMQEQQRAQMDAQARNAIGGSLQEMMRRRADIKYGTKNF